MAGLLIGYLQTSLLDSDNFKFNSDKKVPNFDVMTSSRRIDIEIDKLTRSIENIITGDSFKT